MKEIEHITKKWKAIPCSWIGKINTVKMTLLPKAYTDSMYVFISYENTISIFHRTRTNSSKICMEIQKTLNIQSNCERKEQSWIYYISWIQTILQNFSNQNPHYMAINLLWRRQENTMGNSLFEKWCWETLDRYTQNNQTGQHSHSTSVNKFIMD